MIDNLCLGWRIPFTDLRLRYISGPALQRQVVQGQYGVLQVIIHHNGIYRLWEFTICHDHRDEHCNNM